MLKGISSILIAGAVIAFTSFVTAQNNVGAVAHAPLPVQIQSAGKVFISYAGIDDALIRSEIAKFTGSSNGYYDQFYAAMKSWGRYQLVSKPAEADLIFEISVPSQQGLANPQLTLRILDPQTRILLWVFSEETQRSPKEFSKALSRLLNDAKAVSTSPGTDQSLQ